MNARTEILAQADKAGRDKVLKLRDEIWQEVKPYLASVMEKKCWYCETRNVRADNAVDHFRPKSVYWWLAFNYDNYRFACTLCNSRRRDLEFGTVGGKRDDFPLSPSGISARTPGDDIDLEKPLLLDPCRFKDPPVLWFDESGMPRVNPQHGDGELVKAMVQHSTTSYHLDHSFLVTARRIKFLEIRQLCRDGDEDHMLFETNGDESALDRWSKLVVRVFRAIDRSAEHSAAALCAVRGLRTDSVTAREALDRLSMG